MFCARYLTQCFASGAPYSYLKNSYPLHVFVDHMMKFSGLSD